MRNDLKNNLRFLNKIILIFRLEVMSKIVYIFVHLPFEDEVRTHEFAKQQILSFDANEAGVVVQSRLQEPFAYLSVFYLLLYHPSAVLRLK